MRRDRLHIDLVGQKYNKLTVVEKVPSNPPKQIKIKWLCKCDCGNEVVVRGDHLRRGHTRSCGCLILEINKKRKGVKRPGVGLKGKLNGNWKGGISTAIQIIRGSNSYSNWRNDIFKRDDYTCQSCSRRGCELNAHHISNFSSMFDKEDEILYDLDNGVTFCKTCHNEFHLTFGRKNNNKEQLISFLDNESF